MPGSRNPGQNGSRQGPCDTMVADTYSHGWLTDEFRDTADKLMGSGINWFVQRYGWLTNGFRNTADKLLGKGINGFVQRYSWLTDDSEIQLIIWWFRDTAN